MRNILIIAIFVIVNLYTTGKNINTTNNQVENMVKQNVIETQKEDIVETKQVEESVIENTEIPKQDEEISYTENYDNEPTYTTTTQDVYEENYSIAEIENNEPEYQEPIEEITETEQVNNEPVREPKYCFEGGSEHLDGTGPNEHGFYNTWDEAFQAFEEYTKDWGSGNFGIGRCNGCDLYYFWVTKYD